MGKLFEIRIDAFTIAAMKSGEWYNAGKIPSKATITYAGPSDDPIAGYVIRGHYDDGKGQTTIDIGFGAYNGPESDIEDVWDD